MKYCILNLGFSPSDVTKMCPFYPSFQVKNLSLEWHSWFMSNTILGQALLTLKISMITTNWAHIMKSVRPAVTVRGGRQNYFNSEAPDILSLWLWLFSLTHMILQLGEVTEPHDEESPYTCCGQRGGTALIMWAVLGCRSLSLIRLMNQLASFLKWFLLCSLLNNSTAGFERKRKENSSGEEGHPPS